MFTYRRIELLSTATELGEELCPAVESAGSSHTPFQFPSSSCRGPKASIVGTLVEATSAVLGADVGLRISMIGKRLVVRLARGLDLTASPLVKTACSAERLPWSLAGIAFEARLVHADVVGIHVLPRQLQKFMLVLPAK